MGKVSSWTCEGCTNICFRYIDGEIHKYCKPLLNGTHKSKWVTPDHVECMNKTTDPKATDWDPEFHPSML